MNLQEVVSEERVSDKKKEESGSEVTKNLGEHSKIIIDHQIKIPYSQSLRKSKLDKRFSKFLDIFRKLHISIPFAKALEQMPSYVKFMKEILSNKRKLEEYETVALTKESSTIHRKKLPPKFKDPGSFNIPLMPSDEAFDIYASANAPPSKKKSSRQHPGEGSGKPSRKSARPEDPLAPAPSTNDKLQRLSKHRRSQEAFACLPVLKPNQVLSRGFNELLSGILTMKNGWRRTEEVNVIHAKEIKACEERVKVVEDKISTLTEELKRSQEDMAKVVATKKKFKEAFETNYKEAAKLQEDLEASMKEASGLEDQVKLLETNSQYLERF
ncbi:uncharacterized protein LOC133831313 [Humulus lupulus]|uniref:uncharacterized protein LOC133831313 n=1 Tax=Humulus lupulus TaxID=3486 RepID=UPI002B40E356|nr:uncharacterized protein LOC133831313 [Humulus lupulus]